MARPPATLTRPPSRLPSPRGRDDRPLPPRRPAPPPRSGPPRRARAPRPPDPRRRLRVGRLLLVVLLVIAAGKLVEVQAISAGDLAADAAKQRMTRLVVPAERGAILDRDGTPLAFSVEAKALVANPRRIAADWSTPEIRNTPGAPTPEQRKAAIAQGMGAILHTDPAPFYAALMSDRSYVVLAPLVDPTAARTIREQFPEIAQEDRESRQYPAGDVGGSVVGSASWSMDKGRINGNVGLESAEDKVLAGQDGFRIVDTAEGSDAVIPGSTRAEQPAQAGTEVVLTLDADLQYTVQQKLSAYVARTGAKDGSAVVLDAQTGQVLSLANAGAGGAPVSGDPAVTTPFEPGSVNKAVTFSAALEAGLIRPEDVITVPGNIKVADRTINDAWSHGPVPMTMNGILGKSSNVGTLMTAQRVGPDRFADMLGKLGIGTKTGVELPGESGGSVPPRDDWSGSTFGNLPIGQGLSMTTLQMASMYQAIANDGVRVPPRVISATVAPDGVRTPTPAPEPVRAMSPQTAETMRQMLQSVTQSGKSPNEGTGAKAAMDGYPVAGKTGTAQQVDPTCGCYAKSTYWITFAGMFPADHPRYVVALMLDAPPGGDSAAPLFHDIGSYLAAHGNVPVSTAPPRQVPLQLTP
ncbi:penicillin-binding protein 2 [Actinomycetospora sp. NBRC 106378]|uniref:peptidoglycan D,D-transpeptidase FtsI family protein n=1 Tax=Actinomycetospora sp. NBRC 106378 TaxID=3032208 RepID=UPI0024A1036C|nr:penicillin-binding protein 2 [Actinomycetospora sp. NBRC 106378]GLZ53357.1 penicillin-binding protein B [Actinomycetospora sp. NBRC 106378]